MKKMSKLNEYSSSWTWLQKINRRWNEIIRNICSPLWFQMINSKNVGIFRKKALKEIGSFCDLWYPWFWTWVCPEFQKGLWYPSFWTSGMPWFWKPWLDTHSACSFTSHLMDVSEKASSFSFKKNVAIVSILFRSTERMSQKVVPSDQCYDSFRPSLDVIDAYYLTVSCQLGYCLFAVSSINSVKEVKCYSSRSYLIKCSFICSATQRVISVSLWMFAGQKKKECIPVGCVPPVCWPTVVVPSRHRPHFHAPAKDSIPPGRHPPMDGTPC